ncbi:PREDICTED: uncharacterized protein LOC104817737 [Tarenaya hassleriana]|uniref:uncharacterized protein LOC104817737 n=1 Tax=Tarenaya hassleriana TaxID=28532 RepID=UPI00053C9F94|nr:PREDICTED: uncharacterized protein LOC104817737 [Tarenaya hassleriana]
MGGVRYDPTRRIDEEEDEDSRDSSPSPSSSSSSSSSCSSMSSSSGLAEDDTSSDGPLHDLSDLMDQLPIKRRGLSKFYGGKSQSFTCLANVKRVEDIAKEKWRKPCKGSCWGLFSPKATISKKSTRKSSALSSLSMKAAFINQNPL